MLMKKQKYTIYEEIYVGYYNSCIEGTCNTNQDMLYVCFPLCLQM